MLKKIVAFTPLFGAVTFPLRRKIGSEEFMENMNSNNLNSNFTESGAGQWSSGLNESGSGIVKNKSFWLVADSELIVYGATDPSAKLTIGEEEVPLAADAVSYTHLTLPTKRIV